MKKDAFITSGFLPVPATNGGAVESLVQNLIDENERSNQKKFVVFSIYDKKAKEQSVNYNNTSFLFYRPNRIIKCLDLILFFIITCIFKKDKKTSYKFIIQRIFYLNYVSKILKKNDFNSVIVENNATLFLALKWRKNYIKYKGKYYFHLHNDLDNLYGCKTIIEGSKKILTVSRYISRIVEKKLNYDSNNIQVLMNCIDMERFNQSYSKKEMITLKQSLKISEKDKIIIFVGRTIKEKGILEVIRAFNKNKTEDWTLLIVGSSGFDINVKSDFEKELYMEAKHNKKIIFTGFVPYSNLGNYYAISDLAILPSIWEEPAGLAMLEAISSATPLITTNSGGISEYVEKYGAIILERNDKLVDAIYMNTKKIFEQGLKIDKEKIERCRKEFCLSEYLNNFSKYID